MAQLRVMSWNLHGSAGPDLEEVARRITAFDPDVVGVQEVRARQARRLSRLLGMESKWARKHLPYGPLLWWRAEGMAIFSRFDIADHERFLLNPGTSPFTYRRRIAQRATIRMPRGNGHELRIFNAHLASHSAPEERRRQAVVVAGRIAEESLPVVLTGDLNAVDEAATLAPFTSVGLVDAWPADRDGPAGWTSDSHRPHQRLDYVFKPTGWTTISAEVPPTDSSWAALSDHLPVVVTLDSAPSTR